MQVQSLHRTVSKLLAFFACSVKVDIRFRPLWGTAEQNWLSVGFSDPGLYWCSIEIFVYHLPFTSYWAISITLLDFAGLAEFFPLGEFLEIWSQMPRPQILLIAYCACSRDARLQLYKRCDSYFFAETQVKIGVFRELLLHEVSRWWNTQKTHPWVKPSRLIYRPSMQGREPGVGCARSRANHLGKKSR
jgi:hypothetical protein